MKKIFSYLIGFVIFISTISIVKAEEITLSWTNNSDAFGYRIFKRLENQKYDYSEFGHFWKGDASNNSCTFELGPGKHYFVIRAFNSCQNESGDSAEVFKIVTGSVPSVAIAGPDHVVNEGSTVFLNGSDSRGNNLSYEWQIIVGPVTTITDSDKPLANIIAPLVENDIVLIVELHVRDATGADSYDTVIVKVLNIDMITLPIIDEECNLPFKNIEGPENVNTIDEKAIL